jgi:hypothetical protein
VFGTGKTCLVQQYVHSIFSVKYLSTVGVKIDRKEVDVGGQKVMLMLWDLEGRDGDKDVNPSYIRGAHGLIYVVDGTRPETLEQMYDIRQMVTRALGDIPSVVAINKTDLSGEWRLTAAAEEAVDTRGLKRFRTSAKTGDGVEATFQWLAESTLKQAEA